MDAVPMTSVAISTGREQALTSPGLPDLEPSPSVLQAMVGVAVVAWAVMDPASSPALAVLWLGFRAMHLLGLCRREREVLAEVERWHHRARAALGERHHVTRSLGRYARLLSRISAEEGRIPARVLARRLALARRLGHRCHHLLEDWPAWTAPVLPPADLDLPPLAFQRPALLPLAARARTRRRLPGPHTVG
ncbi:MAG: hypothetical protein HY904_25700 [Deltaproteobacteria bacterium]|nr:hypothetical protein [Deltaproteobacteria bacterium]